MRSATQEFGEQRDKAAVKNPDVDFREKGRPEAECEGTHYRSLENNSTVVEEHFTSMVFRILSESCTVRCTSSCAFRRHCTLDSPLGTQVWCGGNPALRCFKTTEQRGSQVPSGMFALKPQQRNSLPCVQQKSTSSQGLSQAMMLTDRCR